MTIRAIRQYPRIEAFKTLKDAEDYLRKLLIPLQEEAVIISTLYRTFIEGIKAGDEFNIIEILDELPDAGNVGRFVHLTTDNKFYFDDGTAWIVLIIPASVYLHIGGDGEVQIVAGQIAVNAITAEKILISDFIGFPSDENLVGYWSFDEGSGTLAVDGSGNGNNGTLNNMTEADWVDGKAGKCLDFDGDNDSVNCGNDPSLDWGLNDITITLWVKNTGNDGLVNDLVSNKQASEKGIRTYISSGGSLRVQLTDGVEKNIVGVTNIGADGIWHHLAFVLDRSGNGQIYLDGEPDGASVDISALVATDLTTTDNLYIGRYRGITSPFAGFIDEVRIYTAVLTVAEIKALYLYPAGNKSVRISGGQIAANTITVGKVDFDSQLFTSGATKTAIEAWRKSGAITYIDGAKIYTGTITADEIHAGTITADEIKIGGISIDRLETGFMESFEGLTLGNIHGQGVYKRWSTWAVTADANTSATVNNGGDKYLYLLDNSASGHVEAELSANSGNEIITGVIEFEMSNSANNKNSYCSTRQGAAMSFAVWFKDDGNIEYQCNGGVSQVLQAYAAGTWYKIRVHFDCISRYCCIFIDDVFNSRQALAAGAAGNYVDGVRFWTGETASVGLGINNLKIMNLTV